MNAETSTGRDGVGYTIESTAPEAFPVLGISGQLWTEAVRTDEEAEYMIFPRVVSKAVSL